MYLYDIKIDKSEKMLSNVGLEKLINNNSLDAMIEEGGINFSGGEKKRICLARALLRNRDMLIFDELLVNLDNTTTERIEDLLWSNNNKSFLIISYQFSLYKLLAFDAVVDFSMYK